jgi:type II secretory pathway component PulM
MKIGQAWQSFITQRSAREQQAIQWTLGFVAVVALWQIAVAPAWQVWRDSQTQLTLLAQQHADMLALQQQASQLQAQTRMGTDASARTLQSLCVGLGDKVKCSRQALRMTVDVKGVSPQALAQVWAQARSQAQAVVLETHLQRRGELWDGQWVWSLPEAAP